jgi:RimJ/RimL family protein N-acetyltransferase
MLTGDRVVLRPIQRADLPRLWELISDFEVAVLGTSGPVLPRSLAEFEATFDHDPAQPGKDRAYFAIELDGELIGEAGLHRIDHSVARASWASASVAPTGGRGSGRTRSVRCSITHSST